MTEKGIRPKLRACLRALGEVLGIGLCVWAVPSVASALGWPYAIYSLEGVVFDDGGTAQGGFNFRMATPPQFFSFTIETTAGSLLAGSAFTTSNYCWIRNKQPICAPGDDLLITLTNGVPPGQPNYDAFQFAGWYAPNDTATVVLDQSVSYEVRCTQPSSCLVRHVVSGIFQLVGSGRE
jgi:hypothetical protein